MDTLLQWLTLIFDLVLKPFGSLPASVGLCLISGASGIMLLKLFGIFSNQTRIREAKNQIKGNLLGMLLYRDDFWTSLKIQKKIFSANLKYAVHSLVPLTALVLLCVPLLAQLNARFGYRPFHVGEKIKLFIHVHDGLPLNAVSVDIGAGLKALTPPLRIMEAGQVAWKLQAMKQGIHTLQILDSEEIYTKEITVGTKAPRLTPMRSKSLIWSLIYPGEKRLPRGSKIRDIQIDYPDGLVKLFGFNLHWLVVFCIVSILSGLCLKRLLKVEI